MSGRVRAVQVTAGILPGTPEPEYTRSYYYHEKDYEEDIKLPQDQPTKFLGLRTMAMEYANTLFDPACHNWVQLNWIWY